MLNRVCSVLVKLTVVFMLVITLGAAGCGSGGSSAAKCVAGATAACACPAGQQGVQTCNSAGAFGTCMCGATPTVDAGFGDGAASIPDAPAVGGSGGSGGAGGGGLAIDAAMDVSADAQAALGSFPDAAADAGEGEDASGMTPAILSFMASPTTISAGGSSTLSWTVTGASMLTLDQGAGSALVVVLGTNSQTVTPTQTTTYTLTLNGSQSAQVTVTVVPLPVITSFSVSPNPVSNNSSATLTAVFSGGTGTVDQGIGPVTSGVGTSTGPISADTDYALTVTNAVGGSTTAQVTVDDTISSCTTGVSPAAPLLTDFSSGTSGWHATVGEWGATGNLTGSIFSYNGGQAGSTMNAAVDTVGQDLVLSGNVVAGDYSGGGMSFDQCVNTSTYTGVQFTLGGSTAGCDLYLDVQTFDEQGTANKGGCTGSSCYAFPNEKLTSTTGVVTVHFSDLTGGVLTTQAAIQNEIVGLQWQFQSPAPVEMTSPKRGVWIAVCAIERGAG